MMRRSVTLPERHAKQRALRLTSAWAAFLLAAQLTMVVLSQGGAALMDPASSLYQGRVGETISGTVRVSNPMPTGLSLGLYLSDWSFDPSGQFTFADAGTLERSVSDWLTISATTLQLGPNETVDLPYTISVPADAAPGTHWAVIFAESEPTEPAPGQATATFSVRVGHIVYVNIPTLDSSGAIVGMFGTPPSTPDGAYSIIAQYANTGNAAQGIDGTFTVRNELGETVIEAAMERSIVLPGIDRAFQINVVGPLPAGNYTALVVLNYGDPELDVAGAIDFTLDEPLLEQGTSEP